MPNQTYGKKLTEAAQEYPYHLRWDSQAANVAEAIAKGRLARDPRGLYSSTGALAAI